MTHTHTHTHRDIHTLTIVSLVHTYHCRWLVPLSILTHVSTWWLVLRIDPGRWLAVFLNKGLFHLTPWWSLKGGVRVPFLDDQSKRWNTHLRQNSILVSVCFIYFCFQLFFIESLNNIFLLGFLSWNRILQLDPMLIVGQNSNFRPEL